HCTSTLFVSVSRLRPSLTLFPYTTLFRSVVGTDVLGDAARLASGDAGAADVVQQRGLAVVDVAHDGDHRRARDLLTAGFRDLRDQLALGVVALGADRLVAELLGDQHRRVVIDGLGDGGHHAHLEQRLDHVAALHGQLLGQVGHGDRVTDLDLAHHGSGGPLEAVRTGARTGLFDLAARTRLARGGAAGTVGRAQVQLAGETRGAVVVLDPAHHRVRAAVLLLLVAPALLARRCRLAVPGLAACTCTTGFLGRSSRSGQLGFLAQPLGLRLFFLALALGFLGPLAVLFGQPLLLAEVALARLLQLAQDLGALVIAVRGRGGGVLFGGL